MTTVNKLMIGVAVGAILGVLYAPDKGSITRRKLSQAGDNLREKFNDIADAINDKIDSFRSDTNDMDMAYQEIEILESDASAKPPTW